MKRYLAPVLIGIVGTAILIALGVWQVQRLDWKEAVLAEIEARQAQPPIAMPADPNPEDHRFLPVQLQGTLVGEPYFVFTTVKGLGVRFRVINALEIVDGDTILVELGVVGTDLLGQVAPSGSVSLVGMLHWPSEQDVFTPEPDVETRVWYARDLDVLADVMGAKPVLVVVSDMTPPDTLLLPLSLDPSTIPNDHLQYAVTWFGLAVVWVGMTLLWLRRIARTRHLER